MWRHYFHNHAMLHFMLTLLLLWLVFLCQILRRKPYVNKNPDCPLSFVLLLDILGVAIVLLMDFSNVVCKQRLLSNVKKMFCFLPFFLPSFILTPFQYICYLNNSFPNLFYFAFRLEVALGVVWIFSTTWNYVSITTSQWVTRFAFSVASSFYNNLIIFCYPEC